MEETTLYEIIVQEIHSDDESPEKISRRLKATYENASQNEKKIINDIFITLTGWSFETLLEKVQKANQPD
jgi:hypothetical protein